MTARATGTFEVKMAPLAGDDDWGAFGRMSIDKEFAGDLAGTSKGQMLAARTEVEGSAGYVALERVTGTLEGREGTFVLQHNGMMRRGTPGLEVVVVADSATGDLAGLSGTMEITFEGGHGYVFDYTLSPGS